MRAKPLLFLLFAVALVSAYFVFAGEDADAPADGEAAGEENEFLTCYDKTDKPVCVVPNCELEFDASGLDSEKCGYLPEGQILIRYSKQSIAGDGPAVSGLVMPMDAEGNLAPISIAKIPCANPLALKLSFYNYLIQDWIIIEQSSAYYTDRSGLPLEDPSASSEYVMLKAEDADFKAYFESVDYVYLAVVEMRLPYSEQNECVFTNCKSGKSLFTEDDYGVMEDSKMVTGSKIRFVYCPPMKDCDPSADGVCDQQCPQNSDPDCGLCSSYQGDCCDLSANSICDLDCPSTDPDCVCAVTKDGCCSGKAGDWDCLPQSDKNPRVMVYDTSKNLFSEDGSFKLLDIPEVFRAYGSPRIIPRLNFGIANNIVYDSNLILKTQYIKSNIQSASSVDSAYPDIVSKLEGCNYAIDGVCDPDCPNYTIMGKIFSNIKQDYSTGGLVTRFADADCCNLRKEVLDPSDSTKTITLEGIAAADSEKDGCCKATCDTVCDPDCLFGQDPDCAERNFGQQFMLSPNEWAAEVGREDLSEKDFLSGSDTGKCVGCGNGRCEFNVWGGGRFDRPTIGSFKSPTGKHSTLAQGQWQNPPSIGDMIAHNWYYINALKTGYTNPISLHPFFFSRWSFEKGIPDNVDLGSSESIICDRKSSYDETDGYKPLVYERMWADCMQVIHYKQDKNAYSTYRILRGKSVSQAKKSDTYFSEGRSIVEGGEAIFSFMPDKKIEPEFSKLVDDFKPLGVVYPFDETPDNCPQDCGRTVTCPNEVCEPWEFEAGTCDADCSDAPSDYKMKLPLQFWVSEIQDLKDNPEGYCITKERFQEQINWKIYNSNDYLETSSDSDFSNISTKALCAFAHPGEQANCPSGSICGYNCECLAFSDFEKIPGLLDKAVEQGVSIAGEDFYRSLKNFVDKDLDTFPAGEIEGTDCDDSNTMINPAAADVCDGIDNDCNGVVDESFGGSAGSACDKSVWVCKELEPSFKKLDALTGEVAIGCLSTFCYHDKGDEKTKYGRTMFCDYSVLEEGPKSVPYYIYVCDPQDPSDECKLALQSSFEICTNKEDVYAGVCADGRDNDCDELIDSKDPDCFTCNPKTDAVDRCRLIEKKWCTENPDTSEAELVTDGYCGPDACGLVDSSCAQGAEVCAEGAKSCGKGCLPGACDIFANKTCNGNGVWVDEGYADSCGKRDAMISTQCEEGACDYVNRMTCKGELWLMDAQHHCGEARTCGDKYNSDCNGQCEPGACDTQRNKHCTAAKSWSSSDYCENCGYTDSTCGVQPCKEGSCDYNAKKYCEGGVWVVAASDSQYCSRCNPNNNPAAVDPNYICNARPCVKTSDNEAQCGDGLDEDCDGMTDCEDAGDCPANLEICINPPCVNGVIRSCGTDAGLCDFGTQTCANTQWGSCVGGMQPKSEICNSFDDNCDGSVDEGCGDCGAGELRVCSQSIGQCGTGVQQCNPTTGLWSLCYGSSFTAPSTAELCDGVDNNCDGNVDEGCTCNPGATQKCGSAVGECRQGNQTCVASQWGTCTGGKGKLPEICDDGKDNDCDGFADKADSDCTSGLGNALAPTCYDALQNQGETGIDCGGPCEICNAVTCNDRKQNGDEEGLDCGGSSCPPCKGAAPKPKEAAPAESECGNAICEDGEDEAVCPDDCAAAEEPAGFPLGKIIMAILFLSVLGLGGLAVYRNVKAGRKPLDFTPLREMFGKKKSVPQQPLFAQQPKSSAGAPSSKPPLQPAREGRKRIKSLEDEELEKSFKESEKMFK